MFGAAVDKAGAGGSAAHGRRAQCGDPGGRAGASGVHGRTVQGAGGLSARLVVLLAKGEEALQGLDGALVDDGLVVPAGGGGAHRRVLLRACTWAWGPAGTPGELAARPSARCGGCGAEACIVIKLQAIAGAAVAALQSLGPPPPPNPRRPSLPSPTHRSSSGLNLGDLRRLARLGSDRTLA